MTTEIPNEAVEAAARALFERDNSEPWGEAAPSIKDEFYADATAALTAAAPIIREEAWDAVIARIDLGTPYMVDEKYVAGAEWVRSQIIDVLRARAATIEGKDS